METVFDLTWLQVSGSGGEGTLSKLKRTEPGGSILLLKLTKLTNLTKPKLMKKNVPQR
jgi:hypothetical protein